jgi:hypothetical protein
MAKCISKTSPIEKMKKKSFWTFPLGQVFQKKKEFTKFPYMVPKLAKKYA